MRKIPFFIILLFFSSCMKEKLYLEYDQVIDMDENVYHSVTIGSQVWLKENLKTIKFNDNTSIPNLKEDVDWANTFSPAYCWYYNIVDRTSDKGILYNWYAVNTKKLCPVGWHVPSDQEWKDLEIYIGMKDVDSLNWRGKGLATSLKTNHDWHEPGTDDYGFSALPSGFRSASNGHFEEYDQQADWWCDDEQDFDYALRRGIVIYRDDIYRNSCPKNNGISVRCIKN